MRGTLYTQQCPSPTLFSRRSSAFYRMRDTADRSPRSRAEGSLAAPPPLAQGQGHGGTGGWGVRTPAAGVSTECQGRRRAERCDYISHINYLMCESNPSERKIWAFMTKGERTIDRFTTTDQNMSQIRLGPRCRISSLCLSAIPRSGSLRQDRYSIDSLTDLAFAIHSCAYWAPAKGGSTELGMYIGTPN
jgi:hypothetical protein